MLTKPTSSDMIEGVMTALAKDVLPELTSERAQVVVIMAQGVLQAVRQRIEVEQQAMAAEHNDMTALFREMAAALGETPGAEADRMRARARELGGQDDMPQVPSFATINGSYRELSQGLVDSMPDLDALIRAGNPGAEKALAKAREYMGKRVAGDFATNVAGVGMAGRG
ncbi:MAG: hypothetical protein HY875_09185 [Chloroflexi bacterium]|nr:hypothetical protein [Chloroflexota bacterium]